MARIPITLISGWLGSGKTTVLNRILESAGGRRIAVLQNEFGDIGLDGRLIEGNVSALYELSGGCICCSVHDDFMAVIEELTTLDPAPEAIVVETTGVADPSVPLVSILQHPDYGEVFELDGVVTLVDTLNLARSLQEHPEVALQIAAADLLLLSKGDLPDAEPLARLTERLRMINPEAMIEEVRDGYVAGIDPTHLGGFDPTRLEVRSDPKTASHSSGIGAVCFGSDAAIDFERLERVLGEIFERWGEEILRAKGIFTIAGVDVPLLVQGVRRRYSWQYVGRLEAEGSRPDGSRFVVIGRSLPADEITTLLGGATANHY